MKKSVLDISSILSAGGRVSLDAADYSALELTSFAAAAQQNGTGLVLRNSMHLSVLETTAIARAAPGKVTFEL